VRREEKREERKEGVVHLLSNVYINCVTSFIVGSI